MLRVLFDCRNWLCHPFDLVHKKLEEDDKFELIPISIYHNKLEFNKYKSSKTNVVNLLDYYDDGIKYYKFQDIAKLEKKYGITSLWNIVYSDRFIKHWHHDKILEQISFFFYAWENIIDKYKPDIIISETVVGLWNYVLFIIAKNRKTLFLGILPTKNTNRIFFTRDIFGGFPELYEKYNYLFNKKLNYSQKMEVVNFRHKIENEKLVPNYALKNNSIPTLGKILRPGKYLKSLLKDIIQYGINKNYDYKIGPRVYGIYSELLRYLRIKYIFISNIFEKPNYKQKYILFPLQYQPEATTDLWAPYYSDQFSVIESIARSIPIDFILYVKEHSNFLGTKHLYFYRKLKKMPNIRLIDPFTDIHELIIKSEMVITISATTGLEALIMRKRVILFGKPFYYNFPGVKIVQNINQLGTQIFEMLHAHNDLETQILEEKYIYAYINSGHSLNLQKEPLTSEEIKMFIDVIKYEYTFVSSENQ